MITTRKILTSLFTAFFVSGTGSFICCASLPVIFQIPEIHSFPPLIIVGTFLNFFISGALCLLVLLPVSFLEKKRIEYSSFKELLSRYLPLITLPLGLIFCFALFLPIPEKDAYYLLLAFIISIISTCYVCLAVFLKRIKS